MPRNAYAHFTIYWITMDMGLLPLYIAYIAYQTHLPSFVEMKRGRRLCGVSTNVIAKLLNDI